MSTSCQKNRMTTRVITLWRIFVTSLTTSVSTMRFVNEKLFILKAIKFNFKRSYDKQNLTLVVISYETYETRQRLVSYISYQMSTRVRFSIYIKKHNVHFYKCNPDVDFDEATSQNKRYSSTLKPWSTTEKIINLKYL